MKESAELDLSWTRSMQFMLTIILLSTVGIKRNTKVHCECLGSQNEQ